MTTVEPWKDLTRSERSWCAWQRPTRSPTRILRESLGCKGRMSTVRNANHLSTAPETLYYWVTESLLSMRTLYCIINSSFTLFWGLDHFLGLSRGLPASKRKSSSIQCMADVFHWNFVFLSIYLYQDIVPKPQVRRLSRTQLPIQKTQNCRLAQQRLTKAAHGWQKTRIACVCTQKSTQYHTIPIYTCIYTTHLYKVPYPLPSTLSWTVFCGTSQFLTFCSRRGQAFWHRHDGWGLVDAAAGASVRKDATDFVVRKKTFWIRSTCCVWAPRSKARRENRERMGRSDPRFHRGREAEAIEIVRRVSRVSRVPRVSGGVQNGISNFETKDSNWVAFFSKTTLRRKTHKEHRHYQNFWMRAPDGLEDVGRLSYWNQTEEKSDHFRTNPTVGDLSWAFCLGPSRLAFCWKLLCLPDRFRIIKIIVPFPQFWTKLDLDCEEPRVVPPTIELVFRQISGWCGPRS